MRISDGMSDVCSADLGAYVIGTAGSDEKCGIAREAGCDHAVNYSQDGWVERVIAASDGRKANVVYDSVGRHTFLGSLDCAAKFGTVVVLDRKSTRLNSSH